MNVVVPRWISLGAIVLAAACAAQPDADQGNSESAVTANDRIERDAPASACPTEQIYTYLTAEQKEAVAQRFKERNGSSWAPMSSDPEWAISPASGAIVRAERSDSEGPARLPTRVQAQATVKEFLSKNWDLLGFLTAEAATRVRGVLELSGAESGGFHLQLDSTQVQPGYEHIKGAAIWLRFRVQVGADGEVRSFQEVAINSPPSLTLTMAPSPTATQQEEARAQLNGRQIDAGRLVTPSTPVEFEGLELQPMRGGQHLVTNWLLQEGPTVYRWSVDPCQH